MRLLFVCTIFFCISIRSSSQNQNIDSLKNLLRVYKDEDKINVYQSIITSLWLNHPDSAMIFAREAVQLANRLNDPRSKSIAIRLLGGVHYYKGNYDSTIKCSYLAYTFSVAAKDSTLMSTSLNNLGLAYYNVGSYPEALEYLLRALGMKIRLKQEYGLAQTNNNVGLLYLELKNYKQAREYFNKARIIALGKKDHDQILYSSNNIGFTFLDQVQLDSAGQYFKQSLEHARYTDNANWHSVAFSGLAQVRLKEGKVDEARRLLYQSMRLRERIGDRSGIAEVNYIYGEIAVQLKQRDSARYYLHKSLAIARQIDDKDLLTRNFDQLKKLYVSFGKLDSAIYYQTKYIEIRDSVFHENLARNIGAVQVEIEREESKARLNAKDLEIKEITKQAYFLIGGIVITAIFSFFIYRVYKTQVRLTNDLSWKNIEVQQQKEEIRKQKDELILSHTELQAAQEEIKSKNLALQEFNTHLQSTVITRTEQLEVANHQLRQANAELDNFIYRSSHDIRGPLVRLLGVCHVALLDISDQKSKEYFSMLYDTAQQLNEIFDRLKVVNQINELQVSVAQIHLAKILEVVKHRLSSLEGYSEIVMRQELTDASWESDPFLVELILQNLLENAVRFQKRFTGEEKYIFVRANMIQDQMRISVTDNGIGINQDTLDHIYQMFSKAAREHRNIGLGLYIVKQSVDRLNGKISLVNGGSDQTEFEVILPASQGQ